MVICNVCALFVAPLATYGHNAVAVIFGNSSIVTNCFHFKRKYSERPTSLKYSSWKLVVVKHDFVNLILPTLWKSSLITELQKKKKKSGKIRILEKYALQVLYVVLKAGRTKLVIVLDSLIQCCEYKWNEKKNSKKFFVSWNHLVNSSNSDHIYPLMTKTKVINFSMEHVWSIFTKNVKTAIFQPNV